MFPEFYVSRPPDGMDHLKAVYYKVTSNENDGHVFWRNEGHERSREIPFYDLLMVEKNGYGIERVDKSETPWADSRTHSSQQ